MKMFAIVFYALGFLFINLFAENVWVEKIAIFMPYNYRQQNGDISWLNSIGDGGEGQKNNIQTVGVGVRMLFGKWAVNIAQKTNITIPEIAKILVTNTVEQTASMEIDTYDLFFDYSFSFRSKTKLILGGGITMNKVQFLYRGKTIIDESINTIIFNPEIRAGIEYRISENIGCLLWLGKEGNRYFDATTYTGKPFQYNYNSSFFIEPAIMFYF